MIRASQCCPCYLMNPDNKQSIPSDAEKRNDLCVCVSGITLCVTAVGLFAGYMVWLVYSIIALSEVSDATIRSHHGSLLWRYLLVVCIYPVVMTRTHARWGDEEYACTNAMAHLVNIGMASWGSYELGGRTGSDDLDEYAIYTTSTIMVVYQWAIVGVITVLLTCLSLRRGS